MEDPRTRALDAALPLLVERGLWAVSLGDIAEVADLEPAVVGGLFRDSGVVANELYRKWKGELASTILGEGLIDAEPREQFRLFWYRAADFSMLYPHATAFMRASNHAPWLDETSLALETQVHAMLVGFFAQLRAAKVLRDETPEVLVAIVLGAFDGVFEAARRGRLPMTDAVTASAERAVWAAIKR